MSTEAALLRAIRSDPDEDTPRLAYADWLDEHDQPERGELIRVQIDLAASEEGDARRWQLHARQQELLAAHFGAWTAELGSLDPEKVEIKFDRGFPERLTLRAATEAEFALLSRLPGLRRLELEMCELPQRVLQTIALLPQLDFLHLFDMEVTAAHLARLDPLPCWTLIRVSDRAFSARAWQTFQERRMRRFVRLRPEQQRRAAIRFLRAFFDESSPHPAQLMKSVWLKDEPGLSDVEVRFLTVLPDLEEVRISEGNITADGLRTLARLPKLRSLRLHQHPIKSITPLANCHGLETLEVLPYEDNDNSDGIVLGDKGTVGLERLTGLRRLALMECLVRDQTVRRLAPLRQLRSLHLDCGQLKNESCFTALSGLTVLESLLLNGEFTESILQHLASIGGLQMLSVNISEGNGDGFRHLGQLTKLHTLALRGAAVTDSSLPHLAPLANLRTLLAQGTSITERGARALAKRLPDVTIILDGCVVKPRRKAITLRRRLIGGCASALLPTDWPDESGGETDSFLRVTEDGWEKVGHGYSRWGVGLTEMQENVWESNSRWSGTVWPCQIELQSSSSKKTTTAIAVLNEYLDNTASERREMKRGVVKLQASDAASCVFRTGGEQHIIYALASGGKAAVLDCVAPRARFEEFLPLFRYVARSLRMGKVAGKGVGEEAEVAVSKL
jgi:uncharacterized protein (TIGR02996 family)